MRDYINMGTCPFLVNDRVRCNHTNIEGTVIKIDEEHVFVYGDDDRSYYRTWTHELDVVMKKSGGGLTRIGRPEADGTANN